jgi:antagonist of KipI
MLTTVQDLGRWGRQGSGVPVAGPMDAYSHRLANRIVGNAAAAAALEITMIGPELEAHGDIVCAVTGAEFSVTAGDRPAPQGRAFILTSGARLRFGPRRSGARAALAVRGGLDFPPVFGSRALMAGDVLPIDEDVSRDPETEALPGLPLPAGGARLRVVAGPHEPMFTSEGLDLFFSARYVVTPQSNRMGYRLAGPAVAHTGSADILSDATPIGSIQVPKSGQPILLMADRQTTGGYPRIGTVITADLPLAGQLAPGDWIQFVPCTRAAAIDALKQQERRLTGRGR